MKRHLFKVILGGFIVFLALPVIFDADGQEAVVKPAALNASTDADGGSEVMLPVVQKALPFRSENVLSKYAGRFKRFYVNSKEEKQKISQEIQQEQNGLVYASSDSFGGGVRSSYGRAASAEDEAYVKEYFNDVEAKDAPANYGAIAATAGTKQKIHDNAPVKGLYESSAVDSYEARIKAKEVYSNVMSRVDTATSPKVAVEEEEAVAAVPVAKRAVYASAADAQDGKGSSGGTGNKYIGIASKGSSRPSSASGGSLSGGFGRGGVSAKEADASSGGISMGNFEVAAQNVEGKVEKVAPEGGISKSFTVVSNGKGSVQKPSSPANPNQPQKPGTQPNNPNNPGNPANPGNPDNPENPGGGHQHPTAAAFNLGDWPQMDPHAECHMPTVDNPVLNAKPVFSVANIGVIDSSSGTKDEPKGTANGVVADSEPSLNSSIPKEDLVDTSCFSQNLPQFNDKAKKYKILIEAGVTPDGKRAVYTPSESAAVPSIVAEMGGSLYNAGEEVDSKKMPGLTLLDREQYLKIASDKNVLNLAVSKDIQTALPNNTVAITGEQLKRISGLEKITTTANKLVLTNEEKAEAAKKAEQEKIDKNKKEVVDQTKEAVEKANGK